MKKILFLLAFLSAAIGYSQPPNQQTNLKKKRPFILTNEAFFGTVTPNTPPGVAVSSNAPVPSSSGTYTATFTFTEQVTGFVVGDITISGGSLSSFATSNNILFTATVTPSFAQNVSISVGAAVCVDLAGAANTASNVLSVLTSFPFGSIHNDNFNSATLTGYTQTGTTMSAATGDLVINTTAGSHTNYLILSTPNAASAFATHCLEKWRIRILFTCPAQTATSYGFGAGVRSNNGPEQFDNGVRLGFDAAQEVSRGTVYYYTAQNHGAPTQTVATIGSNLMTVGTDYIFEVERVKNVITAYIRSADASTLIKTYTSKTYPITASGDRAHNNGQFAIWAYGGASLTIKNFEVITGALKNAAIAGLGDSNMHGLYAQANANRHLEIVASNLTRSVEIVAGINAEITDGTAAVPSLLALTPVKIYVNLGSNDEANGVADATWQTRYAGLMSALTTGGYNTTNLVLGIPCARNGVDIAAIKTYIDATWSTYLRPDLYTTTKQPANTSLQATYNSGDNIHLSQAGNAACVAPEQTALQ